MKTKLLCVVLCAIILLTTAGCSHGGKIVGGEYSDTLKYAINRDFLHLDPQVQLDGTSETLAHALYDTLLAFEDDGTVVGKLAESWFVSDDHLTWTFKLKRGVKFHNGKELTADDVKSTFERAMFADWGNPTRTLINMFNKVDVVDPYTVSITTNEPYGPMLSLMCNASLSIMDTDYIARYGQDIDSALEAENGTGCFKLSSRVLGSELVVERFDDYFDASKNSKNAVKKVIFKVVPESASRTLVLKTGEVDMTSAISDEDLEDFMADTEHYTVERVKSINQRLFLFGCNDPIMSNPKVRQAIIYTIDRDEIISTLFANSGYPVTAPLAPVTFGYSDLGVIKQDLDKARALLIDAGYPDGFDTKIVTCERYNHAIQIAEIMKQQLANVGINAKIEVWEWSTLSASWHGTATPADFDQPIFVMGAGPSMRDADGGLYELYSTNYASNDRNHGFYSNARVDELVEAGRRETDPAKRVEIYRDAMEIIYKEDPAGIWLFNQYGVLITSSNVAGVVMSPGSIPDFGNATVKK